MFAWVLPQFIDYDEVWNALQQLDAWEVARSRRARAGARSHRGADVPSVPAGSQLWRGSEAYLSSNFAGQLLPPPSASVIQYGYFRDGGYSPDAAGSPRSVRSCSRPSAGSCSRSSRWWCCSLPARSTARSCSRARSRSPITGRRVHRRLLLPPPESSARWLGAKVQRPLSWILVKCKRDPIEDGAASARALPHADARRPAGGLEARLDRRRRQPRRHLPDPARVAPLRRRLERPALGADAFAAFAIAFWAGAVFPVTGSGLGVVDAVLIADADRAEQRLRRRARGRGAPVARLLLRPRSSRSARSRSAASEPQAPKTVGPAAALLWGRVLGTVSGAVGLFQGGSSKRACACSSLPTVASRRSSRPC